ncbi:MAG: transglycosylase family protein [Acidimicrobiia bacterium]
MPPHTGATTRHRPSPAGVRPSRAVAAALVTLALLLGVAAPATAQTSSPASPSAAELRAEADKLSSEYFATLASFASADAAVRDNEAEVADLKAKAAAAKAAARDRALLAYKSSGSGLSAVISGDTTADAARRVKLVDTVNARDRASYKSYRATAKQLRAKQQALRDARKAQEQALADLKAQGAALDAKLAEAQQREQAAAAAAAQAQAQSQAAAAAAATTTTAAPVTTTTPASPTPPPNYSGTPGTSPHHDDPFLSCVRARESGGNYSVVNPAGPYLGAYQFLQATWNGAASHAGRSDLVGVPANLASPFDQDEVAWALYQWQGAGPWGGHCP